MAEVKILSAGEEILTTAQYVEKLDNGTLIVGRKYQTSDGDAKDVHFNNEGTDFESTNVHDALIEVDENISEHIEDTGNPHGVTKTQVGLGNVDNVEQATKTEFNEFVGETNLNLGNKVDKVAGKGLSTNDYDNTEKGNVAANTLVRHNHANKTLLDNITVYGKSILMEYAAATGIITTTLKDQDGNVINASSVDLPLELMVQSGSVKTCVVNDEPVEGYVVGDKYIELVLANSSKIYVLVSDLVDQMTMVETGTGNAITSATILGNVITFDKGKTFVEAEVGKGLSTNDYTNEDKLKVDKLKIDGDGTKYLSDDGSYKEISMSDEIKITMEEGW